MPKPLRVRLELTPAPAGAAPAPSGDARWALNTGAPVLTVIDDLNNDQPITLVIDLDTLRLPASCLALLDHRDGMDEDDCRPPCILGAWDDLTVGADGLTALPRWRTLAPPVAGGYDQDWEVRQILDLIAQKMPIQASVGAWQDPANAASGFFLLTSPATINGRAVTPDPARPVYVGRNLMLQEASVALFGADGCTGAQLTAPKFASHSTSTAPTGAKETPVSDRLKVLLSLTATAFHGLVANLVAENKTDAEITSAVHTAEVTDLKAQLAAKEGEITTLKAQLATGKPGKAPAPQPHKLPGGAASGAGDHDDAGEGPATLHAALVMPEFAHVVGKARLDAVVRKYPHLAIG